MASAGESLVRQTTGSYARRMIGGSNSVSPTEKIGYDPLWCVG